MGFKHLCITAVAVLLFLTMMPPATASPKAIIYELDITASPAVQGSSSGTANYMSLKSSPITSPKSATPSMRAARMIPAVWMDAAASG